MPICHNCHKDVGDFTRTDGVFYWCRECYTDVVKKRIIEQTKTIAELKRLMRGGDGR